MEKLHVTIWNQVIPKYIVKWLGTEALKWDFLSLNPDSLIAVYEQDAYILYASIFSYLK